MPIANKKKVATFIGIAAEEVAKLKAAATRLEQLEELWAIHNPNVTGTPLEGNLTAIANWINAVRDVADNAVANGLVIHAVPTHRNQALGEVV